MRPESGESPHLGPGVSQRDILKLPHQFDGFIAPPDSLSLESLSAWGLCRDQPGLESSVTVRVLEFALSSQVAWPIMGPRLPESTLPVSLPHVNLFEAHS